MDIEMTKKTKNKMSIETNKCIFTFFVYDTKTLVNEVCACVFDCVYG